MAQEILVGLGGVGLFLVGITMLTGGLKELSGGMLGRALVRFTKTPLRGVAAGALSTAVIQSSSATTVTTVGFVSAGLLTFHQGLGVILGANIGTTATGWLIAIFGFKLPLGQIAMGLVFVGGLARLLGRGRVAPIGWALAGFGLLFIGIDGMQQGLAQFEGLVTPDSFPQNTLIGRLQLVAIGIAITLVTQSSSAGVAAALVALGAGAISFSQAAAMVIGMDIGTSFTAVLATMGGSVATRQTGYAHLIYNTLAGSLAFFLLGPVAGFVDPWLAQGRLGNAQIALVGFHTTFNMLGVSLVLPFARPFARLVIWLVPEHGPPLLRRLDERLLHDPAAAVEAAIASLHDLSVVLTGILTDLLAPDRRSPLDPARLTAVNDALKAMREFIEQIRTGPDDPPLHQRHLAAMHALDHLARLARRCSQQPRIDVLSTEPQLSHLALLVRDAVRERRQAGDDDAETSFDHLRALLRRQRRLYRQQSVEAAAQQQISADTTLLRLDGVRWLHRVSYHLWRIVHHLYRANQPSPEPATRPEAAVDVEED